MKPRCAFCRLPGDGMLLVPGKGQIHHDCKALVDARPSVTALLTDQRREALDDWRWGKLRREVDEAAARRVACPHFPGPDPFAGVDGNVERPT